MRAQEHLYFLKADKLVSVEFNESKIKKLKNIIIDKVDKIKTTKNFIAKESLLCEWCYYWNECEVKVGSNPSIRL